jgi:hypothetical protein
LSFSAFRERLPYVALAVILVIAAVLRFAHPLWDDFLGAHPDERHILETSAALDPDWSPYQMGRGFAYGQWPLYLTTVVQRIADAIGQPIRDREYLPGLDLLPLWLNVPAFTSYDHASVIGRALSAFWSVLTVFAAFLLGRRLFGVWAGVIGAGLLCGAALDVQLAHFATFDTVSGAWTAFTILMLSRYAQTGARQDSAWGSIAAGLAVGAKLSALPLIFPLIFAHVWPDRKHKRRALKRTFGALLVMAFAFALSNPYALLEPGKWWEDFSTQSMMVRGIGGPGDYVYVQQYHDTIPWLYPLAQQAKWALGPLLTLTFYGGLIWALVRARRERSPDLWTVLVWLVPFLLLTGSQMVKFPRYLAPSFFALAALGGGALVALIRHQRALGIAATGAVIAVSAAWSASWVHSYGAPHPWYRATLWLHTNGTPGEVVLQEEWDDALPAAIYKDETFYFPQAFEAVRWNPWAEPEDEAKLDALAEGLARADWIIFATQRAYGTIPRMAARYPLAARYYGALFSGELGFDLVVIFREVPNLFGIPIYDDPVGSAGLPPPDGWQIGTISAGRVDESLVAYTRPTTLIFHRTEAAPESFREILTPR